MRAIKRMMLGTIATVTMKHRVGATRIQRCKQRDTIERKIMETKRWVHQREDLSFPRCKITMMTVMMVMNIHCPWKRLQSKQKRERERKETSQSTLERGKRKKMMMVMVTLMMMTRKKNDNTMKEEKEKEKTNRKKR